MRGKRLGESIAVQACHARGALLIVVILVAQSELGPFKMASGTN